VQILSVTPHESNSSEARLPVMVGGYSRIKRKEHMDDWFEQLAKLYAILEDSQEPLGIDLGDMSDLYED
jgi:hypothetical protein